MTGALNAVVELPGSKSITNRALLCAALADGVSELRNVLESDDTTAMMDGLRALGVPIDVAGDRVVVHGTGGRLTGGRVDARLSGTTSRFLLPAGALASGPVTIDGSAPLRARPMVDGIAALRALGCDVDSDDDRLPVTVSRPDGELAPSVSVRGLVSSQFLSGLMMFAPSLGVDVAVDGPLQSAPYVTMTRAVMDAFAAGPTEYFVEPDASAASYFLAAAALCGGTVTIPGLGSASVQGDVRFAEVLRAYGADVTIERDSISVTGGQLLGGEFDMSDVSDTAQTLAAIAPFAESPTTITGIGFIRHKETDRIAAVVTELRRLGVTARELDDGLRVDPGPITPATVETYDDHRMAMSFAILALRAPGVEIADPGCVSKTFPGFWKTLDAMRRTSV